MTNRAESLPGEGDELRRRLPRAGFEHRREVWRGLRAGEQVALGPITAEALQPHLLLDGLNAFGDRRQPERAPEADDGVDDGLVLRVLAKPGDEAAVDLEEVDREPLQVGERRVTGAEV